MRGFFVIALLAQGACERCRPCLACAVGLTGRPVCACSGQVINVSRLTLVIHNNHGEQSKKAGLLTCCLRAARLEGRREVGLQNGTRRRVYDNDTYDRQQSFQCCWACGRCMARAHAGCERLAAQYVYWRRLWNVSTPTYRAYLSSCVSWP